MGLFDKIGELFGRSDGSEKSNTDEPLNLHEEVPAEALDMVTELMLSQIEASLQNIPADLRAKHGVDAGLRQIRAKLKNLDPSDDPMAFIGNFLDGLKGQMAEDANVIAEDGGTIAGLLTTIEAVQQGDEIDVEQGVRDSREMLNQVVGRGKTIKREGPKVGRNGPCPCGCGKKAKKHFFGLSEIAKREFPKGDPPPQEKILLWKLRYCDDILTDDERVEAERLEEERKAQREERKKKKDQQ